MFVRTINSDTLTYLFCLSDFICRCYLTPSHGFLCISKKTSSFSFSSQWRWPSKHLSIFLKWTVHVKWSWGCVLKPNFYLKTLHISVIMRKTCFVPFWRRTQVFNDGSKTTWDLNMFDRQITQEKQLVYSSVVTFEKNAKHIYAFLFPFSIFHEIVMFTARTLEQQEFRQQSVFCGSILKTPVWLCAA